MLRIHTPDSAIQLIKKFEGLSLKKYICPAGFETIGYGHMIRSYENFETISQQQAEELLYRDLYFVEKSILRLIPIKLLENQFGALVSFVYNLGEGTLQRSTLRQCILRGEHEEVPFQLKRFVWSVGIKLKGLVLRREAEAAMYKS